MYIVIISSCAAYSLKTIVVTLKYQRIDSYVTLSIVKLSLCTRAYNINVCGCMCIHVICVNIVYSVSIDVLASLEHVFHVYIDE
jgi:hypothetical protein